MSPTYNMRDPAFKTFCIRRGFWHYAGTGLQFEVIANPEYTKEQHDADDFFRFAVPGEDGTSYQYPQHELDIHWKVIQFARKRMQDFWGLYQGVKT